MLCSFSLSHMLVPVHQHCSLLMMLVDRVIGDFFFTGDCLSSAWSLDNHKQPALIFFSFFFPCSSHLPRTVSSSCNLNPISQFWFPDFFFLTDKIATVIVSVCALSSPGLVTVQVKEIIRGLPTRSFAGKTKAMTTAKDRQTDNMYMNP